MEIRPAAVLFADLAGFTALAEALSLQGPRGAEELSRIIDAHFGRLTDIVLAAGGDILAFAGDAALAAAGRPRD
jgi:class 3 adenylate cyclase